MSIHKLESQDKQDILLLYRSVIKNLQSQDIQQWDLFYPNRFVIGKDLKQGHLYGYKKEGKVIAAVVLDTYQSSKYIPLNWCDHLGISACIHRLAVHPDYQGNGIGKKMLQFAEENARQQGHTSIRLDVYSENPGAVKMYEKAGYQEVGEVRFPFRKVPFMCYEKLL